LSNNEETMLFLDFDGTLAEIRDTPGEVFLDQDQLTILEQLSKRHSLFVLSGRSFNDIQKRVPDTLAGISGDHGAVRLFKKELFVIPEAHSIKSLVKKLSIGLSLLKAEFPNMFLEPKEYSVSVHYRNLPDNQIPQLYNTISEIKHQIDQFDELIETKGKAVWEFRHPEARKENALEWFVNKTKGQESSLLNKRYVFIGDDQTDWNSILWAGNSGGKGIWVGNNYPFPTDRYQPSILSSPREIWKELKEWSMDDSFHPFSD
jgi:trehalose 6-phosphate phosphatase